LIVADLVALKFFPSDEDGRLAVIMLIARMTDMNEERAEWLVKRTLELFDEYPGPRTLRAILCKRFKPADGIEAKHYSKEYPNGLPDEKSVPAPPPLLRQPEEPLESESALIVADFSNVKSLPPVEVKPPTRAEAKQEREFRQVLKDTATNPKYREPEPPPNFEPPKRQSEIISANEKPLDNPVACPEGTYQPITKDNFDELLRLERESKAQQRDADPS